MRMRTERKAGALGESQSGQQMRPTGERTIWEKRDGCLVINRFRVKEQNSDGNVKVHSFVHT